MLDASLHQDAANREADKVVLDVHKGQAIQESLPHVLGNCQASHVSQKAVLHSQRAQGAAFIDGCHEGAYTFGSDRLVREIELLEAAARIAQQLRDKQHTRRPQGSPGEVEFPHACQLRPAFVLKEGHHHPEFKVPECLARTWPNGKAVAPKLEPHHGVSRRSNLVEAACLNIPSQYGIVIAFLEGSEVAVGDARTRAFAGQGAGRQRRRWYQENLLGVRRICAVKGCRCQDPR
mmetsp:Transcript_9979/g.22297  ORF Transcript_9979/g.22297 Transcript_9979/m.22297 type:complete len:234 (-) Transcript_9979:193-894(-)